MERELRAEAKRRMTAGGPCVQVTADRCCLYWLCNSSVLLRALQNIQLNQKEFLLCTKTRKRPKQATQALVLNPCLNPLGALRAGGGR